jgi:F0F1-type ATP synthase assembly protein I
MATEHPPLFFGRLCSFCHKVEMEDPSQPPDRHEESRLVALGMKYAGIATQFAITLLLFGWLGNRLDETKGWTPWGLLTGILSGMFLGVWSMLRQLERLEKSKQDR